MKIALFTDTFFPQINGVSNTIGKMIQYYEKMGIEYKLFTPKYETDPDGCNIETFYSIRFFLYPEARLSIPNFGRINMLLADFKPDIVHNITEFNLGCTGMGYAKAHDVPCVSNYTTNFSHYADYYKLNFLKLPIWNWMKWFHNQNQLTLCPSRNAQKLLGAHGISNTELFSRGIDTNVFNPKLRSYDLRKKLGIENKITFLYVGRVSIEKDMDVLCKSYNSVRRKYKDRTALIVTGDGPYLEKCKRLLPKDTIFTGFKKGAALSEIYASSDVFVCPSSTETFGNVVQEAMASGLAVIGADAGGVGEIILNGTNGIKFKQKNAQELADCMARMIESDHLRNQLGVLGREYAENHSWDVVFDRLVETYGDVIDLYRTTISA